LVEKKNKVLSDLTERERDGLVYLNILSPQKGRKRPDRVSWGYDRQSAKREKARKGIHCAIYGRTLIDPIPNEEGKRSEKETRDKAHGRPCRGFKLRSKTNKCRARTEKARMTKGGRGKNVMIAVSDTGE